MFEVCIMRWEATHCTVDSKAPRKDCSAEKYGKDQHYEPSRRLGRQHLQPPHTPRRGKRLWVWVDNKSR